MTAETVWAGKFLSVVQDGRWEYVARTGSDGAVVIAAIDDDHLLLIEQHRIPAGRVCLELPAGLIGDEGGPESAIAAGARELEEETGYRAATVVEMGSFYSSPGLTSESFTLVRATGLTLVGEPEAGIVVHRMVLSEVAAFVAAKRRAGLGIDAKLLLVLGAGLS
ncbi:NUDIX hydrolase [Sphingomonas sp.]|uniref:NUDIX hydrolase n=1 Tax=Sphingomonas sp. TaxID=28214 RepID=UPI002D7E4058|nr:NUDIX hydrolase [Sphingomonas sp.]HEU0043316.1 NUDIX hydrolase [Sphingomonas sp.]